MTTTISKITAISFNYGVDVVDVVSFLTSWVRLSTYSMNLPDDSFISIRLRMASPHPGHSHTPPTLLHPPTHTDTHTLLTLVTIATVSTCVGGEGCQPQSEGSHWLDGSLLDLINFLFCPWTRRSSKFSFVFVSCRPSFFHSARHHSFQKKQN